MRVQYLRAKSMTSVAAPLDAVARLTTAIGTAESLSATFDAALNGLRDVFSIERASIQLFDVEGTMRFRAHWVAATVALYITAAYWFTSSTSFANPAITLARSLSDTFAGIAPHDMPLFIVAQLIGAGAAALTANWLFPGEPGRPIDS